MSSSKQPVIFSTDDYIMPSSAALPQFKFFFQIIKEGSIVGNLSIKHKQFSLIGRLQDLCDIFIDNPTVSRKHAILQFHSADHLPSLYDLGSAQGTFVNKQRLPPKAYKKLQLFANVKFGTSSRYYILRCPQLQQKLNQQDEQKEHQFIKTITQQNKILSKQEAKKKYLQLLENDPYFGGQLKSRKFQGYQPEAKETNQKYEGITWGIGDESQVYAFRNQKEFPIEADVLRRLPVLDQTMLQKIAQFQEKFRIYDQIEAELNELSNREKRQFGLEQKLQNKKEKLQKKFVESLEALERCQDWIRVNIFGEQNTSYNNKNKKNLKEADTFSDDQFYDRTLENKNISKEDNKNGNKTQQNSINQSTVEDLWMLKNSFLSQLSKKKQLINLSHNQSLNNKNNDFKGTTGIQAINQEDKQQQQEDELELFMKENQQNLKEENQGIYERQIDLLESRLKELKQKLLHFLSPKQVGRLEDEVLNPQKIKEKQEKKQKKEVEQKLKLQQTLQKLSAEQNAKKQKQLKREQLEKECQNEFSLKIFDLYRQYNRPSSDQQLSSQEYPPRRPRPSTPSQDDQYDERIEGYKKLHQNQLPDHQNLHQNQNQESNHSDAEEQVVDLTKNL